MWCVVDVGEREVRRMGEGTIYPVSPKDAVTEGDCYVCGLGKARHYCETLKSFIHANCALELLLELPEGRDIVEKVKPTVILDFDIGEPSTIETELVFYGEGVIGEEE